jgi:hypothetical protein
MKETSWDKAPSLIYPILPSSAKPQLDGLVLFSVNPATQPHHPHPPPGKEHFSVNVDLVSSQELEDELNSLANGRPPQFYVKMEDNLNFFAKWKTTSIFLQNGKQPQYFGKFEGNLNILAKWKTTSILRKMEDNLNFKNNER